MPTRHAVVVIAALAFAAPLTAQKTTPPTLSVRVRVVDSAGAVIPGAELTLTRGLRDVVAQGTTDDAGRRTLSFASEPGEFQLMARKVGYTRGDRVFEIAHDGIDETVIMKPITNGLPTVVVTAPTDAKHRMYYIDADQIADATQPLANAWDVVTKLRPDMLRGPSVGSCFGVSNIWVNGKRIVLPPPPTPTELARLRGGGTPLDSRFTLAVVSVLNEIAPEHIEEISYHDCFDTSLRAVGANNAIFVTLKPGVTYKPGDGSYADNDP